MIYDIVDTRPYSSTQSKNSLLLLVDGIMSGATKYQQRSATESLRLFVTQLLKRNQHLSLSAAFSLVPSREHYQILFNQLNDVLLASENEYQFVALPLIMVLGSTAQKNLSLEFPYEKINNILQVIYQEAAQDVRWLDYMVLEEHISQVKVNEWYHAKRDPSIILNVFKQSTNKELLITTGYKIQLVFILGYGSACIGKLLNLNNNLMPLMQFWHEYWMEKGVTPFVNPLPICSPVQGLVDGAYISKKMALDIFITNTIRNLKFANYKIAVVVGTKIGGALEIRLQALEDDSKSAIYSWPLIFSDPLEEIIEDLIGLLASCLIDNIWILKYPVSIDAHVPNYHAALGENGVNPLG